MPARSSTRLPSLISGFSMTFAKDLFKRELVNGGLMKTSAGCLRASVASTVNDL